MASRTWSTPGIETIEEYRATRFFPTLDGLRAVSVTAVILYHTGDRIWKHINGYLGVTIFFVISGYLITTLLLREERNYGGVDLGGFYIRRICRILPLYAVALVVFSALVLILGLGDGSDDFVSRLPLLATFNGEFAGPGTFGHSWSLGIEEKFYVLWPVLAFFILRRPRRRFLVTLLLLLLSIVLAFVPTLGYFGIYSEYWLVQR